MYAFGFVVFHLTLLLVGFVWFLAFCVVCVSIARFFTNCKCCFFFYTQDSGTIEMLQDARVSVSCGTVIKSEYLHTTLDALAFSLTVVGYFLQKSIVDF